MTFNEAWRELEADGKCDHIGGKEYHRIYWAWVLAGMPKPPEEFIVKHANMGVKK